MILLFFGKWIFEAFDITLDAFRIGGGALLFLSAVGLVNGKVEDKKPLAVEDDSEARISDIAVVPLAIPVTVGPGTIAALLVIGADASTVKTHLLSKVTGLILAAMASQMIFTGVRSFLVP